MRSHRRAAAGALAATAVAATMFALPGTATATPTPMTAAATPTASPTPKPAPKLKPVVKIATRTASVVFGSTASITFQVTLAGEPWAGQEARVDVVPIGKPVEATDVTTDAEGKVTVTRMATGRFTGKLTVAATDTTTEATSLLSTVLVTSNALVSSPRPGEFQAILYGANGQNVQVQRLVGKSWTRVAGYTANRALYALTAQKTGEQYRIVVPNTTVIAGLTSAAVTIS